ncbi:hypothetical protein ILYODFUR_015530 [Ilyodon furcidens]|uniref:Uncharacterized protein n=1 Tax=Ilyodon furcidens TaxID=33524 RepID=A0ABV0VEA7_9TELE
MNVWQHMQPACSWPLGGQRLKLMEDEETRALPTVISVTHALTGRSAPCNIVLCLERKMKETAFSCCYLMGVVTSSPY